MCMCMCMSDVRKKGGISVILRGYLCYLRGVSLLLHFLRVLCGKARSYALRLNTLNTVKGYRPPLDVGGYTFLK